MDTTQTAFLSHPLFTTSALCEIVLSRVAAAKARGLIPAEKIWLGVYFDREIAEGVSPPIAIRWVDDEVGRGVFAEKRIPPRAYVGEYTGVVSEQTPEEVKEKRYCIRYPVWDTPLSPFVIDAEEQGHFTRFLNHSERPNLYLQSVYWRGMPRMIF